MPALPAIPAPYVASTRLRRDVRQDDLMRLPVMPPVKPMLAASLPEVPEGEFLYEPKWDGFRAFS